MDLDTSLESMLQHARVALGRRTAPHGTPPKQQPVAAARATARRPPMAAPNPATEADNATVRELLETSDVDRWLATARPDVYKPTPHVNQPVHHHGPPRCMSPSRQVLEAAGHDKHILPTIVSHRPTNVVGAVAAGSSRAPSRPPAASAAVVRQGTLEDVLSNVVVRQPLPMRIDPMYRARNFERPSVDGHGYSLGDRVSGFYNDRPATNEGGVWGPNGELAIGFDENDNPVVVVRSASSGGGLTEPAAHGENENGEPQKPAPAPAAAATSKVSSVQSQALSSFEVPPPQLVLSMPPEPPLLQDTTLAGSTSKSPTLSVGGGKPLPTPTGGAPFKDVQFHFITPNLLSNAATSPPPACEPLGATAAKPMTPSPEEGAPATDAMATSGDREAAATPEDPIGTAPPSCMAPRQPPSPNHHRQDGAQTTAISGRSSVAPHDNATQTERVQPSPTEPPQPPLQQLPSAGTAPKHPQLPSDDDTKAPSYTTAAHQDAGRHSIWEQHLVQTSLVGGQRPLPLFRIPSDDDGIVFVGPHMRMDDRDPSFVSAMSQRDDRRHGVIPPLEFRRLIVGEGSAAATSVNAQPGAAEATSSINGGGGGSRAVVPAPTSRSQSVINGGPTAPANEQPPEPTATAVGNTANTGKPPVTVPLRTYHSFHDEFPPPPPKAPSSRCWCC